MLPEILMFGLNVSLPRIASRVAILFGDAPLPGEWPNGPATTISQAMVDFSTGEKKNVPPELKDRLERLGYIDENGITEEGSDYMRDFGIL